MLKKVNKDFLNKLNGEHKQFANKFLDEIKSKCKMNSESNEAINQTLIILYDGYINNLNFQDIINNQDNYINEIINTLKPKRDNKIKLILLYSLIINILVFSVILYFTTYKPIQLERPNIVYEINSKSINWEPINNVANYEIYVNDKLVKKTKWASYDFSKYYEYDLKITVKAIGEGRYKTSSSTINININKEYIELNELSDSSPIYYGALNDQFYSFKSYFILYDINNKAYIKYKPIYNGYYRLSNDHGKINSIKEDGILLNNLEYVWFYSGKEYDIELEKTNFESYYSDYFKLELKIYDQNTVNKLPTGKTIFKNPRYIDVKPISYNIENNNITISHVENIEDNQIYYNQYCNIKDGLIIVNNESSFEQILSFTYEENIITNTAGTFTLKPGYTNIVFSTSIIDKNFFLIGLYFNNDIKLYFENGSIYRYYKNENKNKYDGEYIMMENENKTFVFYNPNDTECVIEYGLFNEIVVTNDSDILIPFGYSLINPNKQNIKFNKMLYIQGVETDTLTYLPVYGYYIVFNPWKDETVIGIIN